MRIIISLCFCLMFSLAYTQEQNELVENPDQEAEFIGGATAFQQYLAKNIEYPSEAVENDIYGRVYIAFVVEKDGTLTDIIVERGSHQLLDDEALRLIKKSSKNWKPAEHKGQLVRSKVRIPITFHLN